MTPGGRGGRVVYVTSLADSGPGSLREALTLAEPRTIVFSVSGLIRLQSPIYVGDFPNVFDGGSRSGEAWSFLTLAGETAPGGGITIADYGVTFANGVHDVVIRNLRFRNAKRCTDLAACGFVSFGDGVDFFGASNVVLDHCSFSWATDENTSGELGTNTDITVQRSIVAEVLWEGGHPNGVHSRGMLWTRGADRISVHHNLFISNNRRNPRFVGNNSPERASYGPPHPVFDLRNNLVYNWGEHGVELAWGAYANVVANLFLHGPDTDPGTKPISMLDDGTAETLVFVDANDSNQFGSADQAALVAPHDGTGYQGMAASAFSAPSISQDDVSTLLTLLPSFGALPHDAVDERLQNELLVGAGSVGARNPCDLDLFCPDGSACAPGGVCPPRTHADPIPEPAPGLAPQDTDLDGICDKWERRYGLDFANPADGALDPDGDGYTNLEEYLHTLLAAGSLGATDADEDLVGDVCDVCPDVTDPDQDDADGDGIGDACDLCATEDASQRSWIKPRLIVNRVDNGVAGDDRLTLRGTFEVADPSATVDPTTAGLIVEVRSATGHTLISAQLPPGPYLPPGPGWTVKGNGTRFTFRDNRDGGSQGFVRATLKALGGGRFFVKLKAKSADFPITASDAPLSATVVLGDTNAGLDGLCGEVAFAPSACAIAGKGTRITCK